jgi:glucokinase
MSGERPAVGVDIGASKIQVGRLLGGAMDVLAVVKTPQDPEEAVELVGSVVDDGLDGDPAAIGVGCPGPLDPSTGVVLSPPNLRRWWGFPLREALERRLRVPARVDNDGNVGALGEAWAGAGRGAATVFYLAIGTGLGAGIVKDRAVHRGRRGLAAEVWAFAPGLFEGHGGEPVNDVASGRGIEIQARRMIREGLPSRLDPATLTTSDVARAAADGDAVAEAAMTRARDVLAAVIIFGATLLAPDVVVLGGGLCRDPACLVDPVRSLVAERMPLRELADLRIERSALWEHAVLWGAVHLFAEPGHRG